MNCRDQGFTLLELMVVLILMMAVATLGFGGVRMGNQVWQRTETLSGARMDDHATRVFLERLLASATPLTPRTGARDPVILFEGQSDKLRMVGYLPTQLAAPGAHLIEISLDPDQPSGAARNLILQWQALGDHAPADTAMQRAVLIKDLEGITLRYGARDNWVRQQTLPPSITLEIQRDAQIWPKLTVWLARAQWVRDA